jgi:hypothetical protein
MNERAGYTMTRPTWRVKIGVYSIGAWAARSPDWGETKVYFFHDNNFCFDLYTPSGFA